MGHCELRVDFRGALEKRESGRTRGGMDLPTGTEGFQCFQRPRCCVFERHIVLLDSRERFADSRSECGGNLTKCVQDIFLSRGLRLFLVKNGSGVAVPGP